MKDHGGQNGQPLEEKCGSILMKKKEDDSHRFAITRFYIIDYNYLHTYLNRA